MSVYIDDRLIQNGDIVSPNPQIEINIWDENELILKTDTLGIQILLQYPCENNCIPQLIYFSSNNVMWNPATTGSPFNALFTPQDLPNGIYTLLVFATDGRGNGSSNEPYTINFEVRSEKTLTISAPYPNPGKEN